MLRIISERNLHKDEEKGACFLDWQKAFDRLNQTTLMKILKGKSINWHEGSLVIILYMDQSVKQKMDQGRQEERRLEEE